MATKRVYQYEAMFLIGQNQSADLAGVLTHIREIVARGHGEILAMRKWDERRLAYEVRGQKRGLYILVYFRAPGVNLSHIERDCNLSEKLLRTLIVRCDHLTEEQMRSADDPQGLATEAKLRAERPAMGEQPQQAAPEGEPEAAPSAG